MKNNQTIAFTPFSDTDLDNILRVLLENNAFHQTNDHRFIEVLQPIPQEHAKTVVMLHKLYADKMIDCSGDITQTDYQYVKNGHRGSDTVYTLESTRRWKEFTTNGHFILTPKGYNCIVSGGYVSKTKKKKLKKIKETLLFTATIITALATAITAFYVIIAPTPVSNNQNNSVHKSNTNQVDTISKKIKKVFPNNNKKK